MAVIAVVQARMGSARLPGKVMKPIEGMTMIELLLKRLSRAQTLDDIVVATTTADADLPLVDHVRAMGIRCIQGSENDVLSRYLETALTCNASVLVRITADCPLMDPALVDDAVRLFQQSQLDYISNRGSPAYPDGLDVEVFKVQALQTANAQTQRSYDREHVTPFLYESGLFKTALLGCEEDLGMLRWTVDEPEDLTVIRSVFAHFKPNIDFGWKDVLHLQRTQPELFLSNQHIARNEGATMSTGQKLWRRAKRIIPGGNMLLSKRAEMFLPGQWPAYFSQAKGCEVWDLDGKRYIDMSIMGIGTNTLGYGHPEVDAAVMQTVKSGNMSTLNCPEEVFLAERLVEIHPWADMVRFARSGGEANAIAIRIARAASGRDKVAICGYHGWHDWYLSANLADDQNLDGHLLPGLEPQGVPRNLKGTVYPFNYNNLPELKALLTQHDIGVIVMEVSRNQGPEDNFLQQVRKLATERGIVLIFDECTSGFRQSFGGLHKIYNVEPDMAMFAKALGNGYAITATIGRREVMQAAQSTFISSTFWTERIGPTAALKTLEVMEKTRSWEIITQTGLQIRQRWQQLADHHGLVIDHWGLPALTGFSFKSAHALAYKTLLTQEMLAKGYLAANSVYVCTAHTTEVIEGYFEALDPVLSLIAQCERGEVELADLLKGPLCHAGFKRLN